jgi:hypothetical protein
MLRTADQGCQAGTDNEASPRSIAKFQNKNGREEGGLVLQGTGADDEQPGKGTPGKVTPEWHQGQVESVLGVAGAGLSGKPCKPSKVDTVKWPPQTFAKTAASAGAACRSHCRQSERCLCVLVLLT